MGDISILHLYCFILLDIECIVLISKVDISMRYLMLSVLFSVLLKGSLLSLRRLSSTTIAVNIMASIS